MYIRIEKICRNRRGAIGVPRGAESGAPIKPLLVLRVVGRAVRREGRGLSLPRADTRARRTGDERVVDGRCNIGEEKRLGKNRVVEKYRHVGSRFEEGNARRRVTESSGPGLQQAYLRHPGKIALDNDVHAVFECERDRILQAQFQLAVVDQLLEARRIRQHAWFNVGAFVRSKDARKPLWGTSVIEPRNSQRNWHTPLRGGLRRRSGRGLLGESGRDRRCCQYDSQHGGEQGSKARRLHRYPRVWT